MESEGDWLTYEQAGQRLGISADAARQRTNRENWQKTVGRDKRPRIRLPDNQRNAGGRPLDNRRATTGRPLDKLAAAEQITAALEAHIETLMADLALERDRLAVERERSDKAIADLEVERGRATKALRDYLGLAQAFMDQTDELVAERMKPWWHKLSA